LSTFGERLRLLRLERKLTGSQLGSMFSLSKSAISSYEVAGRFPDEELLKGWSDFFNVSSDYLLGISDIRNPITPKELISQNNINKDIDSFTVKLVKELINSKTIKGPEDITQQMIDMLEASLRVDIANKKETK